VRVLILGASGMLGHAVTRCLIEKAGVGTVWATIRGTEGAARLRSFGQVQIVSGLDALDIDALTRLFGECKPQCVINCIGLVKQKESAHDPLSALPINALLPHRIYALCRLVDARLVHISTDCVYSGQKGRYSENDAPDASDLYGISKRLGELQSCGAITLRTSIIGHEMSSNRGLVEWFLSQTGPVKGYRNAIFSGIPTMEFARVIRDYVLPNYRMEGIYHVSADPISKFDLLRLIAAEYGVRTEIHADDQVCIDRSLDGSRFNRATGYVAPPWPDLVAFMKSTRLLRECDA